MNIGEESTNGHRPTDDVGNRIGETFGGYRLTEVLGVGGFGTVYLGRHDDGHVAAIKVLHEPAGASPAERERDRERFRKEVEHNKQVKRYFIAEVFDAGTEDDPPWVVTEYVEGRTLRELVGEDGPLYGDPLYRLALATATSLGAVHGANIVHRDFTPSNIIITSEGVRVIDFGIARTLDNRTALASGLIGTPRYMAPEQANGSEVTAAIDVHAWGAVMAFAATGGHVFDAPNDHRILERIKHDTPDLRGVPDYLARIVVSCLHKEPERRPTSYQLLAILLGKEVPPEHERLDGGHGSGTLLLDEGVQAYWRSVSGSRRPPFQIAGVYYADPTELAAGMQERWAEAHEMLSEPRERHALLRWLPEKEGEAHRVVGALPEDYGGADVQAAHLIAELDPRLGALFRDVDMSWGALFSTRDGRAWPYRNGEYDSLVYFIEHYDLLGAFGKHHCFRIEHEPCVWGAPCVLYGRVARQATVLFERLRKGQEWMNRVAESLAFTPREISPVRKGDLVHMLATHDKREADAGVLVAWVTQGFQEGPEQQVLQRVRAAIEEADDPWPVAVALRAQREDLSTVAERGKRLRDRAEARRVRRANAAGEGRDEGRTTEPPTGEAERERSQERLEALENGVSRHLPRGLSILGAATAVVGLVFGVAYTNTLGVLAVVMILAGVALGVIGMVLGRDQAGEIGALRRRLEEGPGTIARPPAVVEDDDGYEGDVGSEEQLKKLRGHLSDFPG
ncbi:MAG TPA: serine/threonine protein kinase [Nocardiopsis listeri]|uniref:serine/threonine-protein kinase n=1 Tax=Nocardiopsis listeri TaxID=53440 RepID=UPI001D62C9D8|nr:serine/threonine-protein kinase [Nocardiopsis listeri]HJE58844.1 serine/threonine protein kinase [Nocardiopsis listeri]